jgi:hypothetical protein
MAMKLEPAVGRQSRREVEIKQSTPVLETF